MGIEKWFTGKIIPRKPLLIFLALAIAILALDLLLTGCGGGIKSEPPSVIEEPVATGVASEETSSAEKTAMAEAEVAWCNPAMDLNMELTSAQDWAPGIQVEICIPGKLNEYTIDVYDGEPEELEYTKNLAKPFQINTILTYFRVTDDNGVVTHFDPALKLRITYTIGAWNQALENSTAADYGRPLVAYLAGQEGAWVESWIEFSDEQFISFPPDIKSNPEGTGVLIIIIEELPDPAIGGC